MVLAYRLLLLCGWPAVLALVLVLTGCGSSPARTRGLTPVALPPPLAVIDPAPLPSAPEGQFDQPNAPEPQPAAAPAAPLVLTPAGVVQRQSPLPVLLTGQPWPTAWSNVWVPFGTWARLNGLNGPAQLTPSPEAVFTAGPTDALIRIKAGSQLALVHGLECLLGFPPRMVGGIPYIHSLDLQKTLQPLLSGVFQFAPTNRVIVLDPGHGGRDSGTRNGSGTDLEKHFTLDWARRLDPILTAAGWKVILTRTNDVDVSLPDRVQIAERAKADVFLSLHFNSGVQNPEMSGVETYCLTPSGLPSNLRRDFEDDPREFLPNNAHDQENLLLASRLHRTLLKVTGAPDRGVRRARFMSVLRGQNRPAVLIEGGYLSNPTESRRIATPSYRQLLAEAVAEALNSPENPVPDSPSTASTASTPSAAASSP